MQKNNNTVEYWDRVWSKSRTADCKKKLMLAVRSSVSGKFIKDEKEHIYKLWWHINQLKPKSIIDVGCGNGRMLYGIKHMLPNCKLLGVDLSPVAIERMKILYRIEGRVLRIEELNKLKKKFEMVVFNDVAEHVDDDDKMIADCKKLLKKNGWFIGVFPNNLLPPEVEPTHVRVYTPESVDVLMKKHFKDYKRELVGGHIIIITQNVHTK